MTALTTAADRGMASCHVCYKLAPTTTVAIAAIFTSATRTPIINTSTMDQFSAKNTHRAMVLSQE